MNSAIGQVRQLAVFNVTEKSIILPTKSLQNDADVQYRLTMMVPKRRYLSYLRERWWVVALCMIIMSCAVLTYETIRPENYTSYAQIYQAGNLQLNVANLFSEESLTYFGTQIELLKSARLQAAAFEKAGIILQAGQKNPYKVEIVQPLKTSMLWVQVTGPDSMLTQRFLQMLIDEYLTYKKETHVSSSEDVMLSLNDELARKEKDLESVQERWREFQKTNNMPALEAEVKSAALYLSDMDLELGKLNTDRQMLVAGLEPLAATTAINSSASSTSTNVPTSLQLDFAEAGELSPETLDAMPIRSNDDLLKSTRIQLAVRQAQRDEALIEHGKVAAKRLDDDIQSLQRTVGILQQQNLAEIKSGLAEIDSRISIIKTSLPVWKTKLLAASARLSDGQKLEDEAKREEEYYNHLLGTLQNVDLGKNVPAEQISVLQSATPAQVDKRYLAVRIALAGIAGLAGGLGIVFAWYLLDDRFVSVRDIKEQFGETILGLVPQIKLPRTKPQAALLAISDVRHRYVESYRHLRSALLLSPFGERLPQTLLFTSASPGDGKTTVAINLARILARSGLRVALVDTDAQSGGMRRLLDQGDQPGVLDYLRGDAGLDAVVHKTEQEGLSLIPSGTYAEPSEGLFLRPQLTGLIRELRQRADLVILDGAPILSSDDVALLVPHTDMVVVVTRPFHTRSRSVRQALDMLYQRRAKEVSIILNRARPDDLAGHYAMSGLAHLHGNGKV